VRESGETYETVGRAESVRGEVVLRRRFTEQGQVVHELRVNGVLVMDSSITTSERVLATTTLDRLDDPQRVLVGGLGLGFTVRALLADHRVGRVDVVELEPDVVEWMSRGLVPETADVLRSPRVQVRIGDVSRVVTAAAPGSYDAILLDVDNGPKHLVYPDNAGIYGEAFLSASARALRPGGALAVWSSTEAPELRDTLEQTVGRCHQVEAVTMLGSRETAFHVYVALREPPPRPSPETSGS
jgi:spermidine synthase